MTQQYMKTPVATEYNRKEMLEEVAQRGHEAIEGYRLACDLVEDQSMAYRFGKYAEERKGMLNEINMMTPQTDVVTEIDPSMLSNIHRTWMQIRSEVMPKTTQAVIKECLRGEEVTLESYGKLAQTNLVDSERQVVNKHMKAIQDHMQYLNGLIV